MWAKNHLLQTFSNYTVLGKGKGSVNYVLALQGRLITVGTLGDSTIYNYILNL